MPKALEDGGGSPERPPAPEDGDPAIGSWPGLKGYYLAVSHSAVTLAPRVGNLVVDELVAGRERRELAPYRLDRLLGEAPAPPVADR